MQTTNQIEVGLARERVAELYTCHDLLPSWSPGFVSFEVLHDGRGDMPPTFKQRYVAMGREVEEVITLLEDGLPHRFRLVADNGGTLTRETEVIFEEMAGASTRVVICNTFSGEKAPYLVQKELQSYTQKFLEAFKAFSEGR